jgi:hypothetical protein
MPISDEQYIEWLTSDNARVVLAEFTVKSGGSNVARYLSDMTYITVPGYVDAVTNIPAGTSYDDIIIDAPTIRQAIGEPLGVGEVIVDNSDGSLDSWLNDIADGKAITILIGDPSWPRSDFRKLFTGIIDHIEAPTHDTLALIIRDRKERLNGPLQDSLYTNGVPKPLAFGFLKNIEPVLTNSTLPSVYQSHDGAIYAVNAVRVNGSPWAYTSNTAAGTITLSNQATGRVTMDIIGARTQDGTRGLKRASEFLRWVLVRMGMTDADIDWDSMAALDAKLDPDVDNLGYYVNDRRNAVQAIDEVLASLGCYWSFGRTGQLKAWRLDAPTGTAALALGPDDIHIDGLRPIAWEAPWKRVRLGAVRNWTIQDRDGMYEGLPAETREYYGIEYPDGINEWVTTADAGHLGALSPGLIGTFLADQGGPEAQRLASLRSVQRRVYAVDIIAPSLPVELGTEVSITYPRFGFEGGANAIVIGIEESFSAGRVTLEVWR